MLTDSEPTAAPPRPCPVGVRWDRQTLQLRDEEVFGSGKAELCSRFLHRVFSIQEVQHVRIDRPRSTAQIRYTPGKLGMAELLQRLADAIRGTAVTPDGALPVSLIPHDLLKPQFTIHRHLGLLTTWEVTRDQPGLICVRHEMMAKEPSLAQRIAHQVESVHGVRTAAVGTLTGTLKIGFDPAQTRTERLLRALESTALAVGTELLDPPAPSPVKFGLVNTAVALSVVSDFIVPSVWPATAALLVGSNLKMFRETAAQLGRKQVGLPALYTTIAAGTLATGQFLPWAVMNWMMRFWKQRYQDQLSSSTRLLGDVIQQQRFARLESAGGVEVEVPVGRLSPGDLIVVSAGEKLAVDGRIVRGHGLVDERVIRGAPGLTRKGPGDAVHAGSMVLNGDFQVETHRRGSETRAAALGRVALAALHHPLGTKTATLKGERFASRVVTPTLVTAGLGLTLGGIPTALAILDTDYASGPGLAYPLESVSTLAICHQQGIVVRDIEALDRLAKADVLVLDHHPELEATEPEVAAVRVFPGHTEFQVLRYAASALRDLDDERTAPLRAECLSRRIALLDRIPADFGTDVTLHHRGQVIKVGNLGGQGPAVQEPASARVELATRSIDSLMVGINGQIAGLVDFRPSSRLRAATAIQELRNRSRQPLAIGLVSHRHDSQIRHHAAALGVDFQYGGLSTGDLVQLIRGCQRRGLKVGYVGECLKRARAAREADVAISLDHDGLEELERNPASILLLQPDLSRLGVLSEVSRVHRKRILSAEGGAFLPNLFCVAGAFFLGFSSLTTVLITNLGTGSTYARTASRIRRLKRRLARSSGRRGTFIAG